MAPLKGTSNGIPPQNRADDAPAEVDDCPPGCRPIAGMRTGWYYDTAARMVLHRARNGAPVLQVGEVPTVVGTVAHLTDDGEYIRIEYQVRGPRQQRPRIVTEDELDKGTWAAKLGCRRPSTADARQALAFLIRAQSEDVPEVPARTHYNDGGDLVLPDADAQPYGYGTRRGTEESARAAWDEIGAWAALDPQAALMLGAFFVGPILDSLDQLAHVVNLTGPGQQGKSTALTAAAALYGDVRPRRQQLMMTWNASKQGITQSLRARGFLPVALDEHSSSGRTVRESSREISQIVAGCIRAMGGADGSPRESDGFWHSVLLSSSNDPLKWAGQTEDLATRLQEVAAPFFPNQMVNADGDPVELGTPGAEHVAKRLKRLAKNHGGWPLHWAHEMGLYEAGNLAKLAAYHRDLCAAHGTVQGGIAATIAELHMAWVVGAHMLALVLDAPELREAALDAAHTRLSSAVQEAEEANRPDGERLWGALDALRLEATAFPSIEALPGAAADGSRKLRGFVEPVKGLWWVLDPVVKQAAAEEGVENLHAALRQLHGLGVHLRPGSGRDVQRQTPEEVRRYGLTRRMHCFDVGRADEVFGLADGPEGDVDDDQAAAHDKPVVALPDLTPTSAPTPPTPPPTPPPTSHRHLVGGEKGPLTCDAPTPPTTPTHFAGELTYAREDAGVGEAVPDVREEGAPAVRYPDAPVAVTDREWLRMEATARGRAASALRVGVLGADGLHLPNREPVTVPLPGSVDEIPQLMAAYKLKTLYLHADVLPVLGLPEYDPMKEGGPQGATACGWGTPGAAIERMTPESGVSCWMTLHPAGGGRPLNVAIPAYEDRMDRQGGGRGGFGGAPDAATLLDALIVFTLSTRHGTTRSPKFTPYYLSPNRTAEDVAGGRERPDLLCEAVRRRDVPPVATKTLISAKWHRDPAALTAEEKAAPWLHQFDKSAAYLAAYSNVQLGIGEPTHDADGRAYDPKRAGWWRVTHVPAQDDPRLPGFVLEGADGGGHWVSTPCMDLLVQLFPDWTPEVVEAWTWEHSTRALAGMYERLRTSRERILDAIEEGRPGAVWAKQVTGKLYQSFRGYLGRGIHNVKRDRETGEVWDGDVFWRPDWSKLILAHAMANTFRNLHRFATTEGRFPLSLSTDAVTYTSEAADPEGAKPTGMTLGSRGGQWTHEGAAPMGEVLPVIEGGKAAGDALGRYLSGRED